MAPEQGTWIWPLIVAGLAVVFFFFFLQVLYVVDQWRNRVCNQVV